MVQLHTTRSHDSNGMNCLQDCMHQIHSCNAPFLLDAIRLDRCTKKPTTSLKTASYDAWLCVMWIRVLGDLRYWQSEWNIRKVQPKRQMSKKFSPSTIYLINTKDEFCVDQQYIHDQMLRETMRCWCWAFLLIWVMFRSKCTVYS